jgi:hypothetical protein
MDDLTNQIDLKIQTFRTVVMKIRMIPGLKLTAGSAGVAGTILRTVRAKQRLAEHQRKRSSSETGSPGKEKSVTEPPGSGCDGDHQDFVPQVARGTSLNVFPCQVITLVFPLEDEQA